MSAARLAGVRLAWALLALGCEEPAALDVVPSAPASDHREAEAHAEAHRRALEPEVLSDPRATLPAEAVGGGGSTLTPEEVRRAEASRELLRAIDANPGRAEALTRAMTAAVRAGPDDDPCGRLFAGVQVLDGALDAETDEEAFRAQCEAFPPELRACLLGPQHRSAAESARCDEVMPGFPSFGGLLPGPTEGPADFELDARQREVARRSRSEGRRLRQQARRGPDAPRAGD
ncbi:MAG: hypothetical protein AAGH15_08320 [Myxococcota bacterium]